MEIAKIRKLAVVGVNQRRCFSGVALCRVFDQCKSNISVICYDRQFDHRADNYVSAPRF